MNMNALYGLLIALVPVLFAVIFARRYNFIHGFISYLVFGFVLVFCLNIFGSKLPAELVETTLQLCVVHLDVNELLQMGLVKLGLESILDANYGQYIYLGIYVLVFLISHLIAMPIRRSRVKKIKALKQEVKRY